MKHLLFGNPHTSHWKLVIKEASKREEIVVISGELHAEFFVAQTPMCINPVQLEAFAAELEELDRTLQGSARLTNSNTQSEVDWVLTALPLGHIHSAGRFKINQNELRFDFQTDQTQLQPLRSWVKSALSAYANHDA